MMKFSVFIVTFLDTIFKEIVSFKIEYTTIEITKYLLYNNIGPHVFVLILYMYLLLFLSTYIINIFINYLPLSIYSIIVCQTDVKIRFMLRGSEVVIY